jgi:hypothetical protein
LKAWADILAGRFNWLSRNLDAIRGRRRNSDAEARAYEVLTNGHSKLMTTLNAAADRSCGIRCGSLCCFFPPDGLAVQLDLESVGRIREHLKAKGVRFEDYVRKCDFGSLPAELLESFVESDYVFVEDGVKKVYEVATSEGRLSDYEAANTPLVLDGRRIWVDANCRPCAFLTQDRLCSLYIAGIRPHFCGGFICATSIALKMARQLGYLADDDVSGLDFAGMNCLAGSLLDAFDRLVAIEREYDKAFMDLGEAYVARADVRKKLSRFRDAERTYLSRRGALFRGAIRPGFSDYLRRLFS